MCRLEADLQDQVRVVEDLHEPDVGVCALPCLLASLGQEHEARAELILQEEMLTFAARPDFQKFAARPDLTRLATQLAFCPELR